ncbi:MAG TPA: tetratricopeptide repeat protein [Vicinamibacterales bacterium]|nr:tetratricopeptide repeat protein [Vicinamibacterales bacterium]
MRLALSAPLVCLVCISVPAGAAAQAAGARAPQQPAPASNVAQAYEQFLLGHHLEEQDDIAGAIAAYQRASDLDPSAAEIPAELAALYLRRDRLDEAVSSAERALKIDAANREAHRVLGMIAAVRADGRRLPQGVADENMKSAIDHLERAVADPVGEADPNARGTLARLYLRSNEFEKAIPVLVDLVRQQPAWAEGPRLLAQAYAGAGRTAEAIELLDQQASEDPSLLPTLADFYERQRRWSDAANAYARALNVAPRNTDLKIRYAQALLNVGGRDDLTKARDALNELVSTRNDARALYMLSQANRRLGDVPAAEAAARRLISVQDSSPWGYYALALALETTHQHQEVIDALTPAVAKFRGLSGDRSLELGMLLPHLGFAHQELGEYDKALAVFDEAYRLSPKDPSIAGYLIGANIAAKKYTTAIELAKKVRANNQNDLALARLEAQALQHDGKSAQGIALMEELLGTNGDNPAAYVALAQVYADASRHPQAVKLLQDAQAKFPSSTSIVFELGATLEKQKNYVEAEAAFKQVLVIEPDNAAALNYIGYMLAERGERLDESVEYLKKALEMEPDNGSFLDSIGWAYFKAGKLDLAEENLKRAADQMRVNSVVQEHYGQVLFRMGRFEDAIAAWNRALAGDGASIDREDIDRRIREARQRLKK